MTESNPKVALLGRPGPAREHLRMALANLGGEITIEGEPGELAPAQVAATRPSVVVVSLDAAMEDQLDDWDELFDAEGLNVIFDEAETTSQLDGWDLARWARHLAAKILGHDQTLPPPPEGSAPVQGAVDWIPSPGGPASPAAQMDAERLEDYAVEALDHAGSVPVADDPRGGETSGGSPAIDGSAPVDGEHPDAAPAWANDLGAVEAEELELDDELAALIAQHDANAAQDGMLRFDGFSDAGDDALDELEVVSVTAEDQASDDQADSVVEGSTDALTAPEFDIDDASADADGLGDRAESVAGPDSGQPGVGETQAQEESRFSFGRKLELMLDDEIASGDDAPDQKPAVTAGPAGGMSFDQLAAAFELEDAVDEDSESDAAVRGVVVLLAGMGGPDALRQLLSALPQRMPVAVVVWQQLNAGTHDRLASQLAKTGKVETELAKAGEPLRAGMVYILPPGVGIDCEEGITFNEDPGSPASLITALGPLGDSAVVVALSGAESAWLVGSEAWTTGGGRLLAQSPTTCFEASACESLVKQGVTDAPPADLAIRALAKWHEDI